MTATSRAISGVVVEAGIHTSYEYGHRNKLKPPYAVVSTVDFLGESSTRDSLLDALDGVLQVSNIQRVTKVQVGQSDGNECYVGVSFVSSPDRLYTSRFESSLVDADDPAQIAKIMREFILIHLPKVS